MKLPARLTTLRHLAIGPLVGLLFAGCQSLFDPPRPAPSLPTQREIIQAARDDYDYGPKRAARDTLIPDLGGPSVHDDSAPVMTIETMRRKGSVRPDPLLQMLARINSDRDYPHMGIRRGDNFVWRDISNVNWITPNEAGARSHRLVRVQRFNPRTTTFHEPGLMKIRMNSTGFIVCLDCLPVGHCGYQ